MSTRTLIGTVTSGPNFFDLVDSFVHAHKGGRKIPVEFNLAVDHSQKSQEKLGVSAVVIGIEYRGDGPNRVFLTIAARANTDGLRDFTAHVIYDTHQRNGYLEEIPQYSMI